MDGWMDGWILISIPDVPNSADINFQKVRVELESAAQKELSLSHIRIGSNGCASYPQLAQRTTLNLNLGPLGILDRRTHESWNTQLEYFCSFPPDSRFQGWGRSSSIFPASTLFAPC